MSSNLNRDGNRRVKVRGVTRLDGARGNKQVWRLHVPTWDILELNVCIEESACDIVVTFRRLCSHSAPP